MDLTSMQDMAYVTRFMQARQSSSWIDASTRPRNRPRGPGVPCFKRSDGEPI